MAQILAIVGPTLLFFAGVVVDHFRGRIFPMATFEIGQGSGRHSTLEAVRWTVVIGFLVSIAAGLVLIPFGAV